MSRRNRIKAKGRRESGSFVALPHAVTSSPNYPKLSAKSVKLMVDLAAQIRYRKGGHTTNGDLCAAFKIMRPLGWRSTDTLDAAERELLHFGFIEVTQPGNRRHPTLYAVTWEAVAPIDSKPWITPTSAPSSKWRREVGPLPKKPKKPTMRKKPIPKNWATSYPETGLIVQSASTFSPEAGSKAPLLSSSLTQIMGTSIALPPVLGDAPWPCRGWSTTASINSAGVLA